METVFTDLEVRQTFPTLPLGHTEPNSKVAWVLVSDLWAAPTLLGPEVLV